jgi:ribonuclease Z
MSAPLTITLIGTGGPLPDPHRAGPATLIQGGGEHYLVDAGRGALMRLAAAGVGANTLTAVLITHLHSDHITDLGDVITTQWITTFQPTPLHIVGPPGTAEVVDHIVASLGPDIAYRRAHHDDLPQPPLVTVTEIGDGGLSIPGATTAVRLTTAPTDHRPVEPSIAFRFDHRRRIGGGGRRHRAMRGAGRLCSGADALVHTVIRKDIIAGIDLARLQDTLDYHSSPEEAAQTAARAGVATLVLTHYVPAFPPGGGDDWRELAAQHFTGRVELGDDLHRITIT